MKKIFAFFILLFAISSAFSIYSFAEQENISDQETFIPNEDVIDTSGEKEPSATFIERLQESWESGDITTAVTLLYNIVCTVFLFILKASSNANTVSVKKKVDELTDTAVQKVNEVVNGYNITSQDISSVKKSMIEFQLKFDELAKNENDSVKEMQEQIDTCNQSAAALASMLQTIYSNSTTIPQSVKDIINQKYLEVIKASQAGGEK